MTPKRPLESAQESALESSGPKKPKNNPQTDREAQVRRAKERIAQLKAAQAANKAAQSTPTPPPLPPTESSTSHVQTLSSPSLSERLKPVSRGLNVELHPLLSGKPSSTPLESVNPNLQKVNKRGFAVNPYLDSMAPARRRRELKFVEQGHYVAQAAALRTQQVLAEKKRKLEEMRRKAGLNPDLRIKEDQYKIPQPPDVEWWDAPFVNGDYSEVNMEAVSIYLQHPVPISAPWERHLPDAKAPHMTKKEMKRKRRNERSERYQLQQDRIKLGLEKAPPPKVKLSNLMSVLTDEAIRDPTAVEKEVRRQVDERKKQHDAMNEERKLNKEEKHKKIEEKKEKDVQKGYFSAVFVVDQLVNPSHRFKVDLNAQQLGLVGTVLYGERLVLVVVEGSEKSIRFYKKLMLNRIKWQESTTVDDKEIDLTGNKCELLWEGQVKDFHFKKWGVFRAEADKGALEYLSRFGIDSYYREALAKKDQ